jgi:hypothetical protein
MPIIPLFGQSVKGKSSNISSQRRVNMIAQAYGEGQADKTPYALMTRHGLVRAFDYNQVSLYGNLGGPIRGMIVRIGLVETIFGAARTLSFVGASAPYFISSLENFYLSSSGPVQFASNGAAQVMSVDGVTAYDVVGGGSFSVVGIAGFPDGARSVCSLSQRFVVEDPTVIGRFRWSGINDITDWDPLNFATAESNPDPLVLVFERGGDLLLFGNRTLEFWAPTTGVEVFARIGGAGVDWGLGAFDTVRKVNDSVFFLGRNLGGDMQVCELRGYEVQPLPNQDVAYAINQDAGPERANAVVHTINGHTYYVLNLTNISYAYDTSNQVWCEWSTEGGRYAGQYSSQYRNTSIISDYRDGRVYYPAPDLLTDDNAAIVREIVSRHVFGDLDWQEVSELHVDVQTGVGLNSGQGSDPVLILQISKDGGHTWGNEIWGYLGKQGQYTQQVIFRRLGVARDFTFRLRVPDAVDLTIMGAALA